MNIITIFFYILIFVLGCAVGSFLNLVADRVMSGESIFFGRSKCDFCGSKLKAFNLVPIFSFLIQKARSACCKRKLSWMYPVSEIISGLAFVFAAYYSKIVSEHSLSNFIVLFYLIVVLSFYLILMITDAKHHILPDKIMFPAIITTILLVLLMTFVDLKIYHDSILSSTLGKYLIEAGLWSNHLTLVLKRLAVLFASSFFISLFFLLLILVTKGRGMGGGDVKLGFLIGLFNGFPGNILAVFLGFLFGSIYSLLLISIGKKKLKDTIAFGPFLILGSLVAFVFSEQLLSWYFGLF